MITPIYRTLLPLLPQQIDSSGCTQIDGVNQAFQSGWNYLNGLIGLIVLTVFVAGLVVGLVAKASRKGAAIGSAMLAIFVGILLKSSPEILEAIGMNVGC